MSVFRKTPRPEWTQLAAVLCLLLVYLLLCGLFIWLLRAVPAGVLLTHLADGNYPPVEAIILPR
jgi:hypothetical protein